jgi:hypothetical protein
LAEKVAREIQDRKERMDSCILGPVFFIAVIYDKI